MRESCCCEVDPRDEKMEKMRIENAELLQHINRLEDELGKERAYLKALVTIINKADFSHT